MERTPIGYLRLCQERLIWQVRRHRHNALARLGKENYVQNRRKSLVTLDLLLKKCVVPYKKEARLFAHPHNAIYHAVL